MNRESQLAVSGGFQSVFLGTAYVGTFSANNCIYAENKCNLFCSFVNDYSMHILYWRHYHARCHTVHDVNVVSLTLAI